jgi:hypothetical protein
MNFLRRNLVLSSSRLAVIAAASAVVLNMAGCAVVGGVAMNHMGNVSPETLRTKVANAYGVNASDVVISNVHIRDETTQRALCRFPYELVEGPKIHVQMNLQNAL